jgi:exodeoxyribonuclease V alpha subunit
MFIDSSENKPDTELPEFSTFLYGLNAEQMICKLYTETIPKYMGNNTEIQILTPLKKRGKLASNNLNIVLQNRINEKKPGDFELKVGIWNFRVGDRVIQTKNDYDLEVFNGDIGVIKIVNPSDLSLIIEFGVGKNKKMVKVENEKLHKIELAYAITCHKSQGSEFECIIIPVVSQHYIMLYKSLIYTALTRAKKMAIFIGERKAFAMAIGNIKPNLRQTMLKHLLIENKLGKIEKHWILFILIYQNLVC